MNDSSVIPKITSSGVTTSPFVAAYRFHMNQLRHKGSKNEEVLATKSIFLCALCDFVAQTRSAQ